MKKDFWKLILSLFSIFFFYLAATAQTIRHSYHFYNNLSASAPDCGPDLTQPSALGTCLFATQPGSFISATIPACGVTRTVYHNNLHWGLGYPNTSGTVTNTYTIHLYVRNTNWGTSVWTRLIDFSNGLSDNGFYYRKMNSTNDCCLYFWPNGVVGPCPYFNTTDYYLLTFTRNGSTGMLNVYVNNTLFSSYNDAASQYVGVAGTPIYIYRDDQAVPCESGEANFAYLAFTNQFSSQTQVDSVYNLICTIANPGATSDFSVNPSPVCTSQNVTVTYTGNISSPGTGYSFNWNWDGATIISGSGMGPYVVNWNSPGVKNVTLTVVNNACGNQNSNTEQVQVGAGSSTTINQSICEGQSFEGYTTSGVYIDHFINSSGCDSVRTLNLTVKPRSFSNITQSICQGNSYQGYSTGGVYVDTFIAANGCDSVRTLNLTVRTNSFSSISQTICPGQSYLGYSNAGDYVDTLVNAAGCDSIRTLHLTVRPAVTSSVVESICEGQSYFGYTMAGIYKDTFLLSTGCDSIRTLTLTVKPKPQPNLGSDKEICNEDSIILFPGSFTTYLWQDGSSNNSFVVKQPGNYSVMVTNDCGTGTDDIIVNGRVCDIYFPKAFTPNKDGRNDVFKILNAFNLQEFELSVYNRWGQKIFVSKNVSKGWDGNVNGKTQSTGVYVWYCRFKKNNVERMMKGTVVLIR